MAAQTQVKTRPPANAGRQRKAGFTALQAGKEALGYLLEYIHRDLISRLDGVDRRIDNLERKVDTGFLHTESKVDGKIEKQTRLMLWIMGIGFTVIGGGLLTVMLYLHSDTKQDMQKLETNIKQDMQKLETRIKQDIQKLESSIQEIRTLLIQKQDKR